MPHLFLGLIGLFFVALFWVAWIAVWVIAALVWLVWPLALLVMGSVMWRAQSRRQSRLQSRVLNSANATRPERARPSRQSGNAAFDGYRDETLRHLDEERQKFGDFLERLRKAKDKEAFDSFIAERRARPTNGTQGATA